ncbi:MAG: hypothetical protein ABEK59_05725 [Halobacteria archaeon]
MQELWIVGLGIWLTMTVLASLIVKPDKASGNEGDGYEFEPEDV